MKTQKIVTQRNNNRLQRLVIDIKSYPKLDFNPRANPNNEIFNKPIKI